LTFLCGQLCFNCVFGEREHLLAMLRFVASDASDDFEEEYGDKNDYAKGYEEDDFGIDELEEEEMVPWNMEKNCVLAPNALLDQAALRAPDAEPLDGDDDEEEDPALDAADISDIESDDEVELVGSRTREERDIAGRKRAIDLEVETPQAKRKPPADLETRVATARSLCSAQSDAKFRELFQAAFDEYMLDRISAAELDRRKARAREQAQQDSPLLTSLESAFDAHTRAIEARASAAAAEDKAKAELEAVLERIETEFEPPAALAASSSGAGPSGVVKSEADAPGR